MLMACGSSDAPLTDCLLGQFFSLWKVMMARGKLSVRVACSTGGNVPPPPFYFFSLHFFIVLLGNAHVEQLPGVCVCVWKRWDYSPRGETQRTPRSIFWESISVSAAAAAPRACGSRRISASAKNPEGVAHGGGKSSGWDGVVSHRGLAPVYVGIFFSFPFLR